MECIARQPEIAWAKLYTHRYICENYAWPRERSPQLQSVVPWMRYFGKKNCKRNQVFYFNYKLYWSMWTNFMSRLWRSHYFRLTHNLLLQQSYLQSRPTGNKIASTCKNTYFHSTGLFLNLYLDLRVWELHRKTLNSLMRLFFNFSL